MIQRDWVESVESVALMVSEKCCLDITDRQTDKETDSSTDMAKFFSSHYSSIYILCLLRPITYILPKLGLQKIIIEMYSQRYCEQF